MYYESACAPRGSDTGAYRHIPLYWRRPGLLPLREGGGSDVVPENLGSLELELAAPEVPRRGRRRSDEEVEIHGGADRVRLEAGRSGHAGGGRVSRRRRHGSDVLRVEEEVRQLGRERTAQAEDA